MSEQDPNMLAGIRPRTPEQDMRDVLEKKRAMELEKAYGEAAADGVAERKAADLFAAEALRRAPRPGDDAELPAAYHSSANAAFDAERQRALLRLQQQNVLNRAVNHIDATTLANAMAGLSQEVEAMARHVGRLDELVRSLLDSKAPFTDDDVAAIKAHVRHPGALEAAKLRETVRCLRIAADNGNWTTVSSILGGLDAEG